MACRKKERQAMGLSYINPPEAFEIIVRITLFKKAITRRRPGRYCTPPETLR